MLSKVNMIRHIIVFGLFASAQSDRKVWIQSTRLDNPQSWDQGQLPCQGQSMVLPEEVMYVTSDFHFGPETVLPSENGLLIFAMDGTNIISPQNIGENAACKRDNTDKSAHFLRQKYSKWFDPQLWASESYQNGPFSPIPHVQRVPCRYDEAIFPPESAYKVSIADHPVEISRLAINNVEINSVQFRALTSGGGGIPQKISKLMFEVNETVQIHQDSCPQSIEGCSCHRDEKVKRTICALQKCQPAKCSSAIKPIDHCCFDICGAAIHIQKPDYVDVPFNLAQVEDQMKTMQSSKESGSGSWVPKGLSKGQEFTNVRFFISRLNDKDYQIVVTDVKGNHEQSQKFASKVYERLMTDYQDYGFYIWLELSGVGPPSAWKKAGNVFGILFVLGLIGALMYLTTRTYKRQLVQARDSFSTQFTNVTSMRGTGGSFIETISPSAPHYENFENDEMPEVGGNDGHSAPISFRDLQRKNSEEEEKAIPKAIETHQGFANPLFDEVTKHTEDKELASAVELKKEPTDSSKESKKSFDNPLFDVMVDITREASKNNETVAEISGNVDQEPTPTTPSLDLKECFEQNLKEIEAKIQDNDAVNSSKEEKQSKSDDLSNSKVDDLNQTEEKVKEVANEHVEAENGTVATNEEETKDTVQEENEPENPLLVEI